MIWSRKKRIIVGVCAIVLSFCIVVGASLGIHIYREYYEEAIPVEGFLPCPDKITVHYKDGEKLKTKRLIGEDIDRVYGAFEALLGQYTSAGRVMFFHPWTPDGYLKSREEFGYMEFHYKQRRKIAYGIKNPQAEEESYANPEDMFSFGGEFDSVSINYFGFSSLSFVGCRNGEYYGGGGGSIGFPDEAADIFWGTVMSCVE